jgi:hypothetical protein
MIELSHTVGADALTSATPFIPNPLGQQPIVQFASPQVFPAPNQSNAIIIGWCF